MATAVGKVILSLSFFLFQRNTLWALRWECYFEFFLNLFWSIFQNYLIIWFELHEILFGIKFYNDNFNIIFALQKHWPPLVWMAI